MFKFFIHDVFLLGMPGISEWMIILIPYFLPTIIALIRNSDRAGAVFVMNFFLGWTIIGWVWALVWAVSPRMQQQSIVINNHLSADKTINPIIAQPNYENVQHFSNTQSLPKQPAQIEMATIKSHQDKISEIQQLKQLFDTGILTQEEFEQQKTQILAS